MISGFSEFHLVSYDAQQKKWSQYEHTVESGKNNIGVTKAECDLWSV